jgi:site-specific recombinase XerD
MSTSNPNGLAVVDLEKPDELRDARGYRRPIATLPGYQACPDTLTGKRLHALIVLLWRTGLRISEALDLGESDLHHDDGSIVVRRGKGGKRRVSMMDPWGWAAVKPWLEAREGLPAGPVFCVVAGPTAGTRKWNDTDVRRSLRKLAVKAGIRKRIAPHQLRHAHAVELWREGVDLLAVQRQLGHARLDVTQLYLRSLAPTEVLAPIAARPAPTVSF